MSDIAKPARAIVPAAPNLWATILYGVPSSGGDWEVLVKVSLIVAWEVTVVPGRDDSDIATFPVFADNWNMRGEPHIALLRGCDESWCEITDSDFELLSRQRMSLDGVQTAYRQWLTKHG
jgi:hypothetical protein